MTCAKIWIPIKASVHPLKGKTKSFKGKLVGDDGDMNKPRKPKTPTLVRAILADNVRRLMTVKYAERGDKVTSLAKDSGLVLSTVQRLLSQETGASVDTVYLIATAPKHTP